MSATEAPEPYCWWCGTKQGQGERDPRWVLVQGPGTAICSDCIDLVTVVVQEARAKEPQRGGH
ncbi:hypothetical protein AB0G79_33155 [Streptomyces sp. NPDC020807]|uniref:hypothetical protein n=1 Tax=Streptomyces sp. NPDC020807 TaxID=3155119 RepID=UPI0033E61222